MNHPVIFIVGPTASGKTGLAINLAKKHNGEIICADSRTVYREMNIGTAKPTLEEQKSVPHWGVDLVDPDQYFSASDFQAYAKQKIMDIIARGKLPFVVGGSGLYVDSLLFDYRFGGPVDSILRAKLESMTVQELHQHAGTLAIELPENSSNKRYVIRAIELEDINTDRNVTPINNAIVVGISTDKIELRRRITTRAEQLFEDGVVEEAKMLGEKYGWETESMKGNIYRLVHEFVEHNITLAEIKEKFITADWRLAKRQLTWFRRNRFIHWTSLDDAQQYVAQELADIA